MDHQRCVGRRANKKLPLSRRDLLAIAAIPALPRPLSAEPSTLKIGTLAFGTVDWELSAMRRLGIDRVNGLQVDSVKLATNDACRLAFIGNSVDTIVSDIFWAARMRTDGHNIAFLPFSASEGAVMVPANSPVHDVSGLANRRLGIAGGSLDKSWLLLRAFARQRAQIDLNAAATLAFGAPPLLSGKLEAGELDAALLYWNFCARLEAKGYREIVNVKEMARDFGIEGPIAFLGYVFDRDRPSSNAALIARFADASSQTKRALASQNAIWNAIRPLMQASDDAGFEALKRGFITGIPRRSVAQESADATKLYAFLAAQGGDRIVGQADSLPQDLYWTGP